MDVSKGRYATPVPPEMHQNIQVPPVRCTFCSSYFGVHIYSWSGISTEMDTQLLGFHGEIINLTLSDSDCCQSQASGACGCDRLVGW